MYIIINMFAVYKRLVFINMFTVHKLNMLLYINIKFTYLLYINMFTVHRYVYCT